MLTVAEPPLVAPLSYEVPNNWPLKPSGLGVNDEFRLLFLTAASTAATSASIYHYNNFVQGTNVLDHENPDPTIRALRGEFRALVSTEDVDARDNTSTTGTGVAIYWLGGAKVADDYGDFYDGSWDSAVARNETGAEDSGNISQIWTGSGNDGTEYFDGTTSRALGSGGTASSGPRFGRLSPSPVAPLSHDNDEDPGTSLPIYAISPVFKVVDQGAPSTQTVPGNWLLIPSAQSSAGDQFRLLFVTSGQRDGTSANIADYNLFVQTHAGSGHEAIRPYRNEFRALASTGAVDAQDNAAVTYTASDTGVAIYVLSVDASGAFDGAKVADDYEDLCDGLGWDSNARKDESGASNSANDIVWTGTIDVNDECVGRNGRELGSAQPGVGSASAAGAPLRFNLDLGSSNTRHLYGLSPVFTVSSAPTPPEAPVVSEVTDLSARVTWTEPSFTGAFPIFQYGVRARRCLSDLDAPCTSWTGWGYVTNTGASARSHVITTYGDDKGTADTADDEDLNLAPETRYQVRVDARSRDDKGTTDTADDETVYSGWSEPTEFITTPAQTDYDTDDDGLIEVGTLAQLNAIRYDLDGDGVVTDNALTTSVNEADEYALGFPFPTDDQCDDPNTSATTETCTGYELTADLDFDTNGSGAADSGDTYWNGGAGWLPIGRFTAVFEGNGHTIANLFIDRSATDGVGLFGAVVGAVRNLGLADADVTGRDATGALAGTLVRSGAISASWSTGSVTGGDGVGGLVGESGFNAEIIASYAAVSVTGVYDSVSFAGGEQVGGLVGGVRGGSVTASYATGSVDGDYDVGGLVGYNFRGTITASYATGRVGVAEDVGGLVGRALQGTVTNSYFDAQTTERVFGLGADDDGSGTNADNNVVDSGETNSLPGNTTAELQGPTGYTGIYADWNLDLDGDSTDDDPWDFGADFNYPALKVDFNGDGTPTYAEFGVQRGVAPPAMLLAASGLDTSNEAILVVTWSAPTFGNPAAPTGYQYRYSSDAGATWDPDWPSAETDTNWLDADTRTFTIPAPLAHRYEIEVRAVYAAPLPLSQASRTVGGGTDYDADDDGLIEVGTLAQLNAIRWDYDGDGVVTDDSGTSIDEAASYAAAFPSPAFGMGCPLADHDSDPGTDPQPACTGYELTADLDFDENGDDSRNDTYNTGSGWDPIGSFARGYFEATFDGNGHTISNLFISRSATDYVGLFGETIGTLRNLGLEDVDVTGQDYVGALAGWSNGIITHSWATGGVAGRDNIGGLIGEMGQFRGNITSSSYAGVSVSGADNVGGLVGHVANGNVMATYATGSVTGTEWVGGLAGYNNEGAITASYATGSVSGTENVGGLVGGWSDFFGATITDSYFDGVTAGRVFGVGQR